MSAHGRLPVQLRHRYRLAAELLAGEEVVDVCCGDGRGTILLARRCSVMGVDDDAAALDMARATLPPGLEARYVAAEPVAWLRGAQQQRSAFVLLSATPRSGDGGELHDILRSLAARGSSVIVALAAEDAEQLAAWRALQPVLLDEIAIEGTVLAAAGAWPAEAPFRLEQDAAAPALAGVLVLANVPAASAGEVDAAYGLIVASTPAHELERLQRANIELQRANQRLARAQLGRFGSAAAGRLAAPPAPPLSDQELEALRNWALELEQRLLGVEAELAAIHASRTWRFARFWWRMRAGLRARQRGRRVDA